MVHLLKFIILFSPFYSFSQFSEKTQAYKMFQRLSGGVPPTNDELTQMTEQIVDNNYSQAAQIAMQSKHFYNITIKQFAKSFFDMDNNENIINPLSDGSLTIMGMIKDDVPFNQLLSADITYSLNNFSSRAPDSTNNNHYKMAEDAFIDFSEGLVQSKQSDANPDLTPSNSAGIFTSREFARIFLEAGTNRAPIRWINQNIFCSDMEQTMDPTRGSQSFVRRDVTRNPTGGIELFKNYCMACHTGMDPMSKAFAYYDYSDQQERLIYTPNQVRPKYNINPDNAPQGYQTEDDQWVNNYAQGLTSSFNFKGNTTGNGAKSLGISLTQSDVFSTCMSKRVFKKICFRDPSSESEKSIVQEAASSFATENNYSMKLLFQDITAKSKCFNNE